MSRVVARCNGVEILDRGDEAWIVRKELPLAAWTMVAGLLACVTLVNGTLQGIYAWVRGGREHALAAFVLLGLGAAFVRVGMGASRARTKAEEAPGKTFLIVTEGRLFDAERRELAALESVRLTRTFQLGSSSRALTLVWPQGTLIIARGDPFGDSVDECEAALESLGMRRAEPA
jgi:hypothetical protein